MCVIQQTAVQTTKKATLNWLSSEKSDLKQQMKVLNWSDWEQP